MPKTLEFDIRNGRDKQLSIFFTAGFPLRDDTVTILEALADTRVDFVEIGFPFSDPVADGDTIQRSSETALSNGMSLPLLFDQLASADSLATPPLVLMGYINPVIQFGIESFFVHCKKVGVRALILPDLPFEEYQREWKEYYNRNNIKPVFLITNRTPEARIRMFDAEQPAFLYVVSSDATTGGNVIDYGSLNTFLDTLNTMKLQSPLIVGFGISTAEAFSRATERSAGAIIGSAFVKELAEVKREHGIDNSRRAELYQRITSFLGRFSNRVVEKST